MLGRRVAGVLPGIVATAAAGLTLTLSGCRSIGAAGAAASTAQASSER